MVMSVIHLQSGNEGVFPGRKGAVLQCYYVKQKTIDSFCPFVVAMKYFGL